MDVIVMSRGRLEVVSAKLFNSSLEELKYDMMMLLDLMFGYI